MSFHVPYPTPDQARRRLGLLLIVLGCLAVVGGGVVFQYTPPPEPIEPVTAAQLRRLDRPESLPHPYIAFQCKKVFDTRVVKAGRGHRNRAWKAYYSLLSVEDRWIVATSDTDVRPGQIKGRIVQWDQPVNVSALRSVYASLSARDQAKLLPVQPNVSEYAGPPTMTGWHGIFPIVTIAGCLCVPIGPYRFAASFGASPAPVAARGW